MNRYFWAGWSAFIIWGFFSVPLKLLKDYSALDILYYRVFMAAVLIVILVGVIQRKVLMSEWKKFRSLATFQKRKTVLLTLLGSILLASNWLLFIYVNNQISVKAASFAYLICPILTVVLAYFVLHEKLNSFQWIAIGICIIGCGVLGYGAVFELSYSLIVAFTYALYLISQRKNSEINRLVVLGVQIVFAALLLLPSFPSLETIQVKTPFFYGMVFMIAIVFTIVPLFLNLYALKGISSSTMGILLYTNPILNFINAYIYFHEPFTPTQIAAYGVIAVAILLFHVKPQMFSRWQAIKTKKVA